MYRVLSRKIDNYKTKWQVTRRAPCYKVIVNKAINKLKKILINEKNNAIETYLEKLDPSEASDYAPWKATKNNLGLVE